MTNRNGKRKNKQPGLFDLPEGKRLKEEGMDLAASNDDELLSLGRIIAYKIVRQQGKVTADDVQRELFLRYGRVLNAAAGSLFKGQEWEFTGKWEKSSRVSNHNRFNRVWILNNGRIKP